MKILAKGKLLERAERKEAGLSPKTDMSVRRAGAYSTSGGCSAYGRSPGRGAVVAKFVLTQFSRVFNHVVFSLLPVLLFSSAALAATYYVAPGGNDINTGSAAAPFKTVQKAANVSSPGDTVYVRAGTYNERIALTRSGTAGAYITFQSYPGEVAVIDGTGLGNGSMFGGTNVSWIKIIGFKIRNHTGAGIQIQTTGSYQGSHVEIRNNEISNQSYQSGYGHAILIATWPWGSANSYTDIIIDGNNIHDVMTGIPSSYNEALTIAGLIDRFQITNNVLDNVSFIGIDCIGRGSQYPRNGIIASNTVRNSGYDGSNASIYIDGAKNITIENNSVHDNTGHGIFTGNEDDYGSPTPVITDNIIVRRNRSWNNARNISIGGGYLGTSQNARVVHNTAVTTTTGKQSNYYLSKGTGHRAKNNIGYFGSTGAFYMFENAWNITTNPALDYNNYYPASQANLWYWYGDNGSAYSSFSAYRTAKNQDTHSITTNPAFTSLSTFDLTLQAGSPAIDAGDFLTRTASAGSGTVIPVSDARYFHAGYGISGVSGDTIKVGTNTVTVTTVNYSADTITVTPGITWNNGDGVSYFYSGSKPDIGAYEHAGTQTADTISPTTPANLSAIPVSSIQNNLTWTGSTDNVGVTGYKIYRCTGAGCIPSTQIAVFAANSYSDTGLSASTVYTYAVAAFDAAGNNSAKSSPVSAITKQAPVPFPAAPQFLK